MKSVLVAMHLVACEPDLLICQDISSTVSRWSDMAACRQDQAIPDRGGKTGACRNGLSSCPAAVT